MASVKTELYRTIRQTDYYWRYVSNRRPWLAYQRADRNPLVEGHQHLLRILRQDGIVVTNSRIVFGESTLLHELIRAVDELETKHSGEIERRRNQTDAPASKQYLVELLGSRPPLDPQSIFVRFALQPPVLKLANSYLGMYTQLSFFNVWRNLSTQRAPSNAQLWHRDLDDRMIFKLFVYLTDVTERDGPLVYAPRTHFAGRIHREPETFGEEGTTARRSNDEQMSRVVPREKWISAVGPKHTVILVDTSGYHKGGFVKDHDRVVYTCMFTSQAAQLRAEYINRIGPAPTGLDPATSFALGGTSS